jgi:hypothetical protein
MWQMLTGWHSYPTYTCQAHIDSCMDVDTILNKCRLPMMVSPEPSVVPSTDVWLIVRK